MAPGCFSPSSNKEVATSQQQQQQQQQQAMETVNFAQKSSILEICIDTPVDYTFHFTSAPITSSNKPDDVEMSSLLSCNQIPLPSTPPPKSSCHDDDNDDEEDESSDDEDESSSESSSDAESDDEDEEEEEEEEEEEMDVKKEADTFEILEQTIIKQKRLAKLKNTDLRRKVLLKRTFDLVLEIMDAENGFNDDEPDSPTPAVNESSSCVQVEEETIQTQHHHHQQQHQQQPHYQALELQLHPEIDDGKPKNQLITTPTTSTSIDTNPNSPTHVVSSVTNLVDDTDDLDDTTEDASAETTTATVIVDQARVPRQPKRRSSASDDDDDHDDDESDEEVDEDAEALQTDQTCDDGYEYTTIYTNDQELIYRRPTLAAVSTHDLNIYNDNVKVKCDKKSATPTVASTPTSSSTDADSRRSDHPRKKLRAA